MKLGFKFFLFLFTGILVSASIALITIMVPRNRVILNNNYDVADLKSRMDNDESFIFFTGFNECPACRAFKDHTIKRKAVKEVLLKLKRKWKSKYVVIGYLGQTSEDFGSFKTEIKENNVGLTAPDGSPHFAFIRNGEEVGTLTGNSETDFVAKVKEVYSV